MFAQIYVYDIDMMVLHLTIWMFCTNEFLFSRFELDTFLVKPFHSGCDCLAFHLKWFFAAMLNVTGLSVFVSVCVCTNSFLEWDIQCIRSNMFKGCHIGVLKRCSWMFKGILSGFKGCSKGASMALQVPRELKVLSGLQGSYKNIPRVVCKCFK